MGTIHPSACALAPSLSLSLYLCLSFCATSNLRALALPSGNRLSLRFLLYPVEQGHPRLDGASDRVGNKPTPRAYAIARFDGHKRNFCNHRSILTLILCFRFRPRAQFHLFSCFRCREIIV
ncbi:hypothetical protein DFP72DRAFT_868150 [Ephemerocybe angulata]|uniref:Secreted protein n=1 Tax=Ephemerocybe angulata TaxID=980116 RepID=A0A8H6MHL1_9AGAR|nr:hypothetical protein DFP72DRAFT_868150 [Tulosesus angulatus]